MKIMRAFLIFFAVLTRGWKNQPCFGGKDQFGLPCGPTQNVYQTREECQKSCFGMCFENHPRADNQGWSCDQGVVVGRPYTTDNAALASKLEAGESDWTQHKDQASWSLDTIPTELQGRISRQWFSAGLHEHASVASFNRQGIALMANGAPAKLIHDALSGALDEIDHAKRSFAIGTGVSGKPFGPGYFPEHENRHYKNLTHLALTTLEEGCVGETRAAARAAFQGMVTKHPGLKLNYEQIRDDETRHAATAWQTISWAVQQNPRVAGKLRKFYMQMRQTGDGLISKDVKKPSKDGQYGLIEDELKARVHVQVQGLMDKIASAAFDGSIPIEGDSARKWEMRFGKKFSQGYWIKKPKKTSV